VCGRLSNDRPVQARGSALRYILPMLETSDGPTCNGRGFALRGGGSGASTINGGAASCSLHVSSPGTPLSNWTAYRRSRWRSGSPTWSLCRNSAMNAGAAAKVATGLPAHALAGLLQLPDSARESARGRSSVLSLRSVFPLQHAYAASTPARCRPRT
jgi:hypothetical protein